MTDGCAQGGLGKGGPPGEIAVFVRALTAAELARTTSPIVIECDESVPLETPDGRVAMVTGFAVYLAGTHSTDATAMPGDYPGRDLYALLTDFQVQALGGRVQYVNGLDARRLRVDTIMREGAPFVADPADIPDATATPAFAIELIHRFGNMRPDHRYDGGIPMAWLRTSARREDSIRFSLAAGLPNAAGVTATTYTSGSLYLMIQYVERAHVSYQWSLHEVDDARTSGFVLRGRYPERESRCHYAVIRHHNGETGGIDHSDYSAIGIDHGSVAVAGGRTTTQIGRMARLVRQHPWHRADIPADMDPTAAAPGLVPLMVSRVWDGVSAWGALPLTARFARATHTTTRYLIRERVALEHDTVRAGAAALGRKPETAVWAVPRARDIAPQLLGTAVIVNPGPNTAGPNG